MDEASGKSLSKMRPFSWCLPFALPLLPVWNLRQMLEMRQPSYDCEATKTHTKDNGVQILESAISPGTPTSELLIRGGKQTPMYINHHHLGHVAER